MRGYEKRYERGDDLLEGEAPTVSLVVMAFKIAFGDRTPDN